MYRMIALLISLPGSALAGEVIKGYETWFHLLPGVHNLEQGLQGALGKGWFGGNAPPSLSHLIMALFTMGLILFLALRYRKQLSSSKEGALIPEQRFNTRSIVELIAGGTLGMMEPIMGAHAARRFLPLIGTLAFFILFSNLLGLVPGFQPSTSVLSTTAACALIVFTSTHIYGLKYNGINHIKHLMGPIWWLAPLMFPIEVISHLVRPMSLSLRLMGNMVGDHMVLAIFLGLIPLFVPIPIMVLGIVVCVVQTLVFCLLSVVYIAMAIEQHEAH